MLKYAEEGLAVFQSELYQTNSVVLQTKDLVLITDPGYLPSEVVTLRNYLDEVKGDRPVYLFFTHSDFDHIAGFGAFTDCIVIAGKVLAEETDRQAAVHAILRSDDGLYIDRPYEIVYPRVDQVIREEGQSIVVGDTTLTFFSAYGHNPDGLMCFVEPQQFLITGDYLSDIEFPFVYYSYADYRSTLSQMKVLTEQYPDLFLLTSHGSVTNDLEEIRKRLAVSEAYLSLTEELLDNPNDERFQKFMDEQGYKFKIGFAGRHADNIRVLSQERAAHLR
jgi:hydroxyacylglutathione hydrolase